MKEVILGERGLYELKNWVNAAKMALEETAKESAELVAEKSATRIDSMAGSGHRFDGNVGGSVSVETDIDGASVVFSGEQVAYIEFGTGIVGENSPYPDTEALIKAGWEYDVNNHGEKGWFYRDKTTGERVWSIGMEGVRPVYWASKEAEKLIPETVRKVFDEKFSG